ncbi:MAG: hypothetical protein ABI651_10515, partial [Verrucomicrobiota bacterium]
CYCYSYLSYGRNGKGYDGSHPEKTTMNLENFGRTAVSNLRNVTPSMPPITSHDRQQNNIYGETR